MDIKKALSVCAYVDERKFIETTLGEVKNAIMVYGGVGTTTITIPRRLLPSIQTILEAEFKDLTAKIEAL